ncbi:MAG: hypothetical protein AMXMBFR53_41900 [Gemmatimonadota bacterium]
MTLILGIRCDDGVVMATDSAATFGTGRGYTIGQQPTRKLYALEDAILYAATGAIGCAQLVAGSLELRWRNGWRPRTVHQAMTEGAAAVASVLQPIHAAAQVAHQVEADVSDCLCRSLVALPVAGRAELIQFGESGAPEAATVDLPCVALGSGQAIADPFLAFLRRVLWDGGVPTMAQARFVAAWTIDHVCRTNPGGVGGSTQLATLTVDNNHPKLEMVEPNIGEHHHLIADTEDALREACQFADGQPAPAPPELEEPGEPEPGA